MFRKQQTKPQASNLRSSDLRKLRAEVAALYGCPLEALDKLLPLGTAATKASLDPQTTLYSVASNPVFVRIEIDRQKLLVPTMYALFTVPTLLNVVLTHHSVASRLTNGADLMLPGVFGVSSPSLASLPSVEPLFPPFTSVQIVIRKEGRLVPVAIGVALMDSNEILGGMRVSKGKCVEVVNFVGDGLFKLGSGNVPEEIGLVIPVEADPISLEDVESGSDSESQDSQGDLEQGRSLKDGERVIHDSPPVEDRDLDDFVVIENMPESGDTSTSGSSSYDFLTDRMESISVVDAESIITVTPSNALTAPQIDTLLEQTLLLCIKFSLPTDPKAYPLPATTVYSQNMIPLLDDGVDVKSSSHKKLQKFLKAMDKKGYLKVKERQQGGELVVVKVFTNHPNVVAIGMDEKAFKKELKRRMKGSGGSGDGSGTNVGPGPEGRNTPVMETPVSKGIEVVELFKSTGGKDTLFTRATLKSATEQYIAAKSLVNPQNPRLIQIDAFLADPILGKDEYATVDFLAREAILTRIGERMAPWCRVVAPGREPVVKKGAIKPILLTIEKRLGRKLVTKITGLESFLISPETFASDLRVPCAASTSVTVLGGGGVSGKPVLSEVMVQGSKVSEVCSVLRGYGFEFVGGGAGKLGVKGGPRCRWVEVVDKS
ncbi:hypothetical protein HDU98_001588 [Podochytrium sp. JEL0797]|nr:hypothetical protein HDU98_001588 [Podochytrium sp. JEL0797]